jgi:small subunit ribosomal protein S6e
MAQFKVTVGDPNDGRSYSVDVKGHHANSLVGKRIGNMVDGIFVGLPGYQLVITGGSDRSGTPMKKGVKTVGKKGVLLSTGPCYSPSDKGVRKRKLLRGDLISPDIWQINMAITKWGSRSISQLLVAAEKDEE